jgi:signal peptidase II
MPLIGDYVRFTLILNRGAAFGISLGPNSHLLLLIISSIAILFIVFYYLRSSERHGWKRFSFGLIAGGAIGNMIDRLAKGEVVDFIDCGIGNLRWPIFNIADISVTLGVLLLLKYSFSQPSQNHSPE